MSKMQDWLGRLARDARLPGLDGSAGAVTLVERARGIAISFELSADGETLHLHGPVGALPSTTDATGALLETVLVMNHASAEPGEGALALDERSERLIYFRTFREAELDGYEALRDGIDAFSLRLDEVAHELESLRPEAVGSPSRPEDTMDPMRLHTLFIRA